jgi:hypothetical protein
LGARILTTALGGSALRITVSASRKGVVDEENVINTAPYTEIVFHVVLIPNFNEEAVGGRCLAIPKDDHAIKFGLKIEILEVCRTLKDVQRVA